MIITNIRLPFFLLMMVQISFAMNQDNNLVRRHIIRFEQEIEGVQGQRFSQYIEHGYELDDDGSYNPIHNNGNQSNSLKDILWRKFITSKAAQTGALLLVFSSIMGISQYNPHHMRAQWHNQTHMCPAHYRNADKDAIIDSINARVASVGAALCFLKCLEAAGEYCNCCSELE